MPNNVVGTIPEFTTDESIQTEVKEATTGGEPLGEPEVVEEEKATPSEPPTEEKPVSTEVENVDTGVLANQILGLQNERVKLLKEIQELRGQRREIKKEELLKVEERVDELKDLHPEDITLIDRVLRSKGYVTKSEMQQSFYESVKRDTLAQFLDKYPEYKPENDPQDVNWSRFNRELSYYRQPEDPHGLMEVLEKAHKSVMPIPSDRSTAGQKRRIELASVGSGGAQRSSSRKSLDPRYRDELSRGGWSEEEIKEMEQNLQE